jgi:hypothetical protein
MMRPARLLAVGILGGMAITIVGIAGAWRVQGNLTRLIGLCEQEDRDMKQRPTPSFKLECDPRQLESLDRKNRQRYESAIGTGQVVDYRPSPGIQGDLVVAQRRLEKWKTIPVRIALVVMILLALPWAWSFLLDRLRELSKAIQGKGAI